MHPMNLLLPWLASWTCHIAIDMLILSCNALWWVAWAHKVSFINLFMSCSVFLLSETVNKTCYVYMGAIISSMPFWLMFSKGLLFYAFSIIMPCLCLLWYVHLVCCFLALNSASWCCFDMLVFSLSLWSRYLLHFCHACLNLLLFDLAVAQCSSFVKNLL